MEDNGSGNLSQTTTFIFVQSKNPLYLPVIKEKVYLLFGIEQLGFLLPPLFFSFQASTSTVIWTWQERSHIQSEKLACFPSFIL